MDTPQMTAVVLGITRDIATLVVMYMVILKFRLPYVQVLLAYAAVKMITRFYDDVVQHRIIAGDRRPTLLYGLIFGMVALLFSVASFIGVPFIATYRFSFFEAVGVLITGLIATNVMGAIVRQL